MKPRQNLGRHLAKRRKILIICCKKHEVSRVGMFSLTIHVVDTGYHHVADGELRAGRSQTFRLSDRLRCRDSLDPRSC